MTHAPHDPRSKKIISSTIVDPNQVPPAEPQFSPIRNNEDSDQRERDWIANALSDLIHKASDQEMQVINSHIAILVRQIQNGTLVMPDTDVTETNLQEIQDLKREKKAAEQELFNVRHELKTKTQNLTKDFELKLQGYKQKLDQSQKQNRELHDQIIQLQTQQDSLRDLSVRTHQQDIARLQSDCQATQLTLQNQVIQLQQQLQAALHRHTPPQYPPHQTFDTTVNDTLIHNMTLQTSIAKQNLLLQAKAYDGKDPKELFDWLDEIDRLSSQNGYTHLEVAIQTSRGSVHKYLQDLQKQRLDWDKIKFKLRERYSDCSSAAAAQNKLAEIRQNGRPLHEYISHFTDLMEFAHNMHPSHQHSRCLATTFINGID
ncbi:MAG: retrotransposon gag domain-containing protein, partial [Proteobacteria bacterium]|nr:retrotransposon gag domain-containing protein [Pseudomonadota bacterium]